MITVIQHPHTDLDTLREIANKLIYDETDEPLRTAAQLALTMRQQPQVPSVEATAPTQTPAPTEPAMAAQLARARKLALNPRATAEQLGEVVDNLLRKSADARGVQEIMTAICQHPETNIDTLRSIVHGCSYPTARSTAMAAVIQHLIVLRNVATLAESEHDTARQQSAQRDLETLVSSEMTWLQQITRDRHARGDQLAEIAFVLEPDPNWEGLRPFQDVWREAMLHPNMPESELRTRVDGTSFAGLSILTAREALASRQQSQVPSAERTAPTEPPAPTAPASAEILAGARELVRNPKATAEQLGEIFLDLDLGLRRADASSVVAIQETMTAVIQHPNYNLKTWHLKDLRMTVREATNEAVRNAARNVLETLAASRLAQLQQIVRDPNADSLQLGDITFALEPEPNREGLQPFQDVWREAMFHPNMSGILLAARLSTEAPAYQTTRAALNRRMAHLLELARNPDTTAAQLEGIVSETRSINEWRPKEHVQELMAAVIHHPHTDPDTLREIANALDEALLPTAAQMALTMRQQSQVPSADATAPTQTPAPTEPAMTAQLARARKLVRNPKATTVQLEGIMGELLKGLSRADASSVAALQEAITTVIRHPNYNLNTRHLEALRTTIKEATYEAVRNAARNVLETLAGSRLAQLQQIVRDPNADSSQLRQITFALEPDPNWERLQPFQGVWRDAMLHPQMPWTSLIARADGSALTGLSVLTAREAQERRMARCLELARKPDTTAAQLAAIAQEVTVTTRGIHDERVRELWTAVLLHPHTDLNTLRIIANTPDEALRSAAQVALAKRQQPPATPVSPVAAPPVPEAQTLSAQQLTYFLEEARHPDTEGERLEEIVRTLLHSTAAANTVREILIAVIRHRNINTDTLRAIIHNQPDKALRSVLMPAVSRKLASLRSIATMAYAQNSIAKYHTNKRDLKELASSALPLLQQITSDPNASADHLADIARALELWPGWEELRPFQEVWRTAMMHPHMPRDVLQQIVDAGSHYPELVRQTALAALAGRLWLF